MLNDRLVDHLVSNLKPVRRRTVTGDILILLAVCAVELWVFLATGAMRPDIYFAMGLPAFWWKTASLGIIAVLGSTAAIASFDPTRSPRQGLRWLIVLVSIALATGRYLDASLAGWKNLIRRLDWLDGARCVAKVAILSLPALVGLGMLMRRGAPTDRTGSAMAAGVAAAAWGAFMFVFACPFDDPLYIAVWYSAVCGLVTLLARWLLPVLTRW